jgi:hypothetical protein
MKCSLHSLLHIGDNWAFLWGTHSSYYQDLKLMEGYSVNTPEELVQSKIKPSDVKCKKKVSK